MRKLTTCSNVNYSVVCGFVAYSHVLFFAVIVLNTINILEIFHVFTVFLLHYNSLTNSPNYDFKEIYGDQSREFICGYWLKHKNCTVP